MTSPHQIKVLFSNYCEFVTDDKRLRFRDQQPQAGEDQRRVRLHQATAAHPSRMGQVHPRLHGAASRRSGI